MNQIDKLIINSPFEEPKHYWRYDPKTRTFDLKDGRRPAGYVVASESSRAFDDPGVFIEIPLPNKIRPRVKAWREHPINPYAGVTGITKRLLDHWNRPEEREHKRLFFCQLEAIETLIWLVEAPEPEKVGIEIPSDGGPLIRLCSKMATGSGKTIVMAMLAAWQILNKVLEKLFNSLTLRLRSGQVQRAFRGSWRDELRLSGTISLQSGSFNGGRYGKNHRTFRRC